MSQYDLLLTQNVSGAGIEFSEKLVNIGKGDLLSAVATTKVPTVLAAGADGTMLVRDDNEVTGLKWVARPATVTDALIFKGTVGTGGTHTIAEFNALATYSVGWTYKIIEAGTIKGTVIETKEIGSLIMCTVARAGSGNVDGDWTTQTVNLDGAVVGPASTTDGYLALFDGITGKIIKAGTGAPGTMAYETATDYIAKTILHANTVLYATSDHTPTELSLTASTILGRKATGNIVALSPADIMDVILVAAPATKDAAGTVNMIAFDNNYGYRCKTTGTAGNAAWLRWSVATNW